ncbi:hypothetical protein KJ758_00850 [Patescibacteria group bacterium]|nr:hypothetical protein [Patescibacteria group bacterium]
MQNFLGDSFYRFYQFLPFLLIWSLVWKGLALWRAAQLKEKVWFVVLIVFNTLGILEIIYLAVSQKKIKSKDVI